MACTNNLVRRFVISSSLVGVLVRPLQFLSPPITQLNDPSLMAELAKCAVPSTELA